MVNPRIRKGDMLEVVVPHKCLPKGKILPALEDSYLNNQYGTEVVRVTDFPFGYRVNRFKKLENGPW